MNTLRLPNTGDDKTFPDIDSLVAFYKVKDFEILYVMENEVLTPYYYDVDTELYERDYGDEWRRVPILPTLH